MVSFHRPIVPPGSIADTGKVQAMDLMMALQTVLITYGLFGKGNKDLLYFSALGDPQLLNTLRYCS